MLTVVPLNWLSIILAAIVSVIIGGIWYSPSMFGNAWMRSMGWKMEDIRKGMKNMTTEKRLAMYGKAFLISLVMAFVLSLLIHLTPPPSVQNAVELGILVWLGFIATAKLSDMMFEGRSFNYYIINVMYYFVSIIVMSFILATWF